MAGGAFAQSDPAALQTAGEVLTEKWEIISGIKQRVENQWEEEIKPGWTSKAADKFNDKVYEFTGQLQIQLDELQQLGELMGQSAANYTAQNEDVESAVDAVDPIEGEIND